MNLELKFQIKYKSIYPILLMGCFFLCLQTTFAQQGIGTDLPSKSAALEIKSEHRGLLIPRVELTALDNFAPIKGDGGTSSEVNSLLVYNIGSSLTEGYYYWTTDGTPEGGKWNRLVNLDDLVNLQIEPWQVQGTTDKATENTDDIYQMGSVAIGKNNTDDVFNSNITLDVKGTLRAGDFPDGYGTIGENSVAIGRNSIAEGKGSFAGGGHTTPEGNDDRDGGIAKGENAFAFGYKARAISEYTLAIGNDAYAKNRNSISIGKGTRAFGSSSVAIGRDVKASSAYEVALGRYNILFSQSNAGIHDSIWQSQDPIFVVGNGRTISGNLVRHNALTILKNGKIGINIDFDNQVSPDNQITEILDIGEGNVRVRDLPATNGDISNPNPDKIVTVDTDGVLRSIEASGLGVGGSDLGPWYDQDNIGNPTTDNTADIYQMGNVAINKNAVYEDGDEVKVSLDVQGAIRGGTNPQGDIGTNSIAVGENVEASGNRAVAFGYKAQATGSGSFAGGEGTSNNPGGVASGLRSFAYGQNVYATGLESFAFGLHVEAKGNRSFAFGLGKSGSVKAEAKGGFSFGFGNEFEAKGNYSFAFGREVKANNNHELVFGKFNVFQNDSETRFQLADGDKSGQTVTPKNLMTILNSGYVGIGLLGSTPATAKPTEMLHVGSGKVRVRDLPSTAGNSTNKIVVVDNNGVLKTVNNSLGRPSMPKYFYMPPYPMPLQETMANEEYVTFDDGTFEIDLYQIYRDQFTMANVNSSFSSIESHQLPYLESNELIYNIAYFDKTVFNITSLSERGILKYMVNPSGLSSGRTYMNIVFEIKDK